MIKVWIHNNYFKDFVTSSYAVMTWDTFEEAQQYIVGSKAHHPGRFTYHTTCGKCGGNMVDPVCWYCEQLAGAAVDGVRG